MPITNNVELPIKYVPVSGPGIDALESRKEHNNNKKVSASGLRASYNQVRKGLNVGLLALITAV